MSAEVFPAMRRCSSCRARGGFSLIELLAVIAIIAILTSILIPVTRSVFVNIYAARSASNLRHLQQANTMYAQENNGKYAPIARTGQGAWNQNLRLQQLLGYAPTQAEISNNKANAVLPVMKSGFPVSTYMPSIGANYNAFGYLNANEIGIVDIDTPARTFMFAEGCDWQLAYASRKVWDPAKDEYTGRSNNAYRFKGQCIAVAFEGNVLNFTKEEAEDRSIWFHKIEDQKQ